MLLRKDIEDVKYKFDLKSIDNKTISQLLTTTRSLWFILNEEEEVGCSLKTQYPP